MAEQYKRHPNTECKICKKSIYRRPAEIEKNQGNVFCSMICSGIHFRKENPCIVCRKSILGGLHKKTCSRHCANINRTGIKYTGIRLKDKVIDQRRLKIRLLAQRGSKCERCDYDKPEILQVHHKDRNRKNSDLANLALICPNCHYEEHHLENSWLNKNNHKN